MADKTYLKYKNKFMLNCLLTAASSLLAIISALCLVFMPFFVKSNGEMWVSSSLFGETLNYVQNLGEGKGGTWSVYQIVSVLYLAAGCIYSAVVFVKCVQNFLNPEKYCTAEFEKIMSGTPKKQGVSKKFSAPVLVVSGIILEIFYVIMITSTGGGNGASLIAQSTGVNWTLTFVVLSLVAYAAVAVFGWIKYGNLKAQIMREN